MLEIKNQLTVNSFKPKDNNNNVNSVYNTGKEKQKYRTTRNGNKRQSGVTF